MRKKKKALSDLVELLIGLGTLLTGIAEIIKAIKS